MSARTFISLQYTIQLIIGLSILCTCSCTTVRAAAIDHVVHNSCWDQKCGDITVGYPFSLSTVDSSATSYNNSTAPGRYCPPFNNSGYFELTCSSDGLLYLSKEVSKPYMAGAPLQLLNVTPDSLILNVTSFASSFSQIPACGGSSGYNTSRAQTNASATDNVQIGSPLMNITFPSFPSPFAMASDNQFVSFGCSFGLFMTARTVEDDALIGGCSTCSGSNHKGTAESGHISCGSLIQRNCCVSDFPSDVHAALYMQTFTSQSNTENPACSSFSIPFYRNFSDFDRNAFALRVLWALPSLEAQNYVENGSLTADRLPGNVCSGNGRAQVNVVQAIPGYTCSCSAGYQGDGYADGQGCTDINECDAANDCIAGLTTCENTDGNYTCHCNSRWHVGDGRTNGSGCRFSPRIKITLASTGASLVMIAAVIGIVYLNIVLDRRRRRKYFMQNGGFELQAYIAAGKGREPTRFFTLEEVKEATQNFAEERKLGAGGFGTVYKGELKDGKPVAVKKAKLQQAQQQLVGDEGMGADKQFVNELVILTQINHRHIVRLLGCCLQTASPLLVYELVSNGDLRQHLARQGTDSPDWVTRLRIAVQTADALAYLHAAATPPILHRDVKSANILLDERMDVKVADFGLSRLVPDGEEQVSTAVQGTIGYLDPEYFQTLHLTDRSDVYSFGVVLAELITGLKAVDSRSREPRFANLALLLVETMREGQQALQGLIDARLGLSPADDTESCRCQLDSIGGVAQLAWRCLAVRGAERPSMGEILDDLRHNLRSLRERTLPVADEQDERAPLLQPTSFEDVAATVAYHATYSSPGSSFITELTFPR